MSLLASRSVLMRRDLPLDNMSVKTTKIAEDKKIKAVRHRPFNPWRVPVGENAKAVVKELLSDIEEYEAEAKLRTRKRREKDKENFDAVVSALVSDLMYDWLETKGRGISVSRSNRVLEMKDRYRPQFITGKLPDILDLISSPELGFVVQVKGSHNMFDRSNQTFLKPGQNLIAHVRSAGIGLADLGCLGRDETIILKAARADYWKSGRRVSYVDTPVTILLRAQMEAINDWIASASIDFDETVLTKNARVDISKRYLRRYFSNSSFEQGGRLFGGFWLDLKKQDRFDGLTINGQPIVELDYSQMAPRLLYGLIRATPPMNDCYVIPGLEDYREGVKKVMSSLLFDEGERKKKPRGTGKLLPKRLNIEEIISLIAEAHPQLKKFFGSGVGHGLQFIESEILVTVLLRLKEAGVVALPCHDAILVAQDDEKVAKRVMGMIYEEKTGLKAIVNRRT